MGKTVRRIVTGHDASGKSVFVEDGPPPQFEVRSNERVSYFELWNTGASPALIHAQEPVEPIARPIQLPPPPGGTIMRIIDVHPGNYRGMSPRPDGRSSAMHRTKTIDYAICLEGEIYAVLDDSETLMRAGDVLIQRGTDHAWENRSDADCRMLFILIDAEFDRELTSLLPNLNFAVTPPSLGK